MHPSTTHLSTTHLSTPELSTPHPLTPQTSTPHPSTPLTTTVSTSTVSSTPSSTVEPTTTGETATAVFSTPSLTTSSPPVCINGGQLQNGVCLCPDEWTGVHCSIANVCENAWLYYYTFPSTVIGWAAYSLEICGPETSNYGNPKATARCMNSTTGHLEFDHLQEIDCGLTLDKLLNNISGPINQEKAQKLATSTQMLTSNPARLTALEINSAAMIINRILDEDTLSIITKKAAAR
ncbi:adhesion G-protein coupled receptor G7-like [Sardina pilchardus]|uniref:adhesion G-protein coupled receptor G7-like n=1 Tax=Sardina pilchardus TaxID=27697 RepID=UPI002E0E3B66